VGDIIGLFLSGCLGGLLAGLLGVGGGIIFVPILTYFILQHGYNPQELTVFVLSNSLFAIFFSGLSGTVRQVIEKNFSAKEVFSIGAFAVLLAVSSSFIIQHTTFYTPQKFTIVFVALLLFVVYRLIKGGNKSQVSTEISNPSMFQFGVIGAATGILSAFSGVGGGIIMVPLFKEWLKWDFKKSTGVSLGVITVMTFFTSIYNAFFASSGADGSLTGTLLFPIVLPMVVGTIICTPIGIGLSKRLSAKTIQWIFITFILLVAFKMIYSLLNV
jgi:uncharacterized protein